jgi:plastocyanin
MNINRSLILSLLLVQLALPIYAKTYLVKITNYKFEPASLTINEGDKITWVNESDMQHTATSGIDCKKNNLWDSGNINPGQKFSHVFTKAGNFPYYCIPHCNIGMKGDVTVGPKKESLKLDEIGKTMHEVSSLHIVSSIHSDTNIRATSRKFVVKMINYQFEPSSLTIDPGDTVVWINTTDMIHTSTSGTNCTANGNWNSGNVEASKQFSYVFSSKGSFPYFCLPHCVSGMTGVIHVGQPSDSLNPKEIKERAKSERTRFPATDIISNQSVTTLPKGYLEFRLYHRFDDIAGKTGNSHNLYGLDNIREERIGFAYGVNNRLMLGIGRNEGDAFQSPYQEVAEIYDGFLKYRLLKQSNEQNGKAPFSLSLFANTAFSRRHSIPGNIFSEALFPKFSDRFSYCIQVLAAYNFRKHLSVQFMPTYLKRNWVNRNKPTPRDEANLFSLGGAARWNFTKHFSVLAEYFYVFSDYRRSNRSIFSNPLAFGVEFYTGKHIFHLNLSNSTGVIPTTFIPYTTSAWGKGEFRLGFTITRLFLINKKNGSKK